jgi:hypothetical protein
MATDASSVPSRATTESKASRKKKAKEVDSSAVQPAPSPAHSGPTQATSDKGEMEKPNGAEGSHENAYIRELQK